MPPVLSQIAVRHTHASTTGAGEAGMAGLTNSFVGNWATTNSVKIIIAFSPAR